MHGYYTTRVISRTATDNNYHFYRIIAEDREFRVSNFLKALADAKADDLDLINISAGVHHSDCGGRCRPCQATQAVVNSGAIVVAGAGNDLDSVGESLYCPAYVDEAIAVGAFHTKCGNTVQPYGDRFPYRLNPVKRPPFCYYLEQPDTGDDGELYGEQMCGQRGCNEFTACSDYKAEELWAGNVDFSTARPDLFAPSHTMLVDMEDRARYQEGTSFSTAYVTGSLAGVFGALSSRASSPTPSEVKSAITMINDTVGGTSWRKYNGTTIYEFLSP